MILTGPEILAQQGRGLTITPFDPEKINPNSYNLTLHNKLLVYDFDEDDVLDMKKPNPVKEIIIPEEGYVLEPGKLYLGRTAEHTYTRDFVPMLEGRSSVGRLGVCIHVTAGFGDIGFNGYWTLELFCIHPVRIYPGVEIGQIYYHTVKGKVMPYNSGKYQNNMDVQPSMLWKDFQR